MSPDTPAAPDQPKLTRAEYDRLRKPSDATDRERFKAMWLLDHKGCWLWTGYKVRGGYGDFWYSGGRMPAHRYAWIMHNGAIPEGLHVLHRCDVPACVNPEHLWLGTNTDNIRDSISKGRFIFQKTRWFGSACNSAKMSDRDVEKIREMGARGITQRGIASQLGVSEDAVGNVLRGKTWRFASGRVQVRP